MNSKFPPYLNNNYKGINPIGGFDFRVLLSDNFIQMARFQSLNFSFDGFSQFNWVLEQGFIEKDYVPFFLDLQNSTYKSFKGPKFIIEYDKKDSNSSIKKCRLYNSSEVLINIGVLPGRRLAVINMKGASNKFESGLL